MRIFGIYFFSFISCISSFSADTVLTLAEQEQMVVVHNEWRSEVGVPSLSWSDVLAKTAQHWAETLRDKNQCEPMHSHIPYVGENIFWASPIMYSTGEYRLQSVSPQKVVDSWGSEKGNYDYGSNTCEPNKVCGHYTQLVWKNTTEVGCGMAVCPDQSQIWSCNYSPPGNYVGEKPY